MAVYKFRCDNFPYLRVTYPRNSGQTLDFKRGEYETEDEHEAKALEAIPDVRAVTAQDEAQHETSAAASTLPLDDLIRVGMEMGVIKKVKGGWLRFGDVSLGNSPQTIEETLADTQLLDTLRVAVGGLR